MQQGSTLTVARKPQAGEPDLSAHVRTALRALVPEACADGRINWALLQQLLGDAPDASAETFGLHWLGKRKASQLALVPATGTLQPCPKDSVDWDTTQHRIIEGDNLDVLKLLQQDYAGKVKLIYLDPPYNTGKDFAYPDDFTEGRRAYLLRTGQQIATRHAARAKPETAGRFHTHWLNMMYPRLILARDLLRQDGLICVSIDDHEAAHLRTICDELFGAEQFVAAIAVVNNLKGRSDDACIATAHESLIVYAKDIAQLKLGGLPLSDALADQYTEQDSLGRYKLIPLKKTGKGWRQVDRPNLCYPVYVTPDCRHVSLDPFVGAVELLPMRGTMFGRWRWGKDTFRQRCAQDIVARPLRGGGISVFSKMRMDELGVERTLKAKSVWMDPKFETGAGGRDLAALGMADVFGSAKPVALIDELLTIAAQADDIVLDFFAGSGTTGHAVLAHNAKSGKRCRFVLVQLAQRVDGQGSDQRRAAAFCSSLGKPPTIAELTKERVRRAAVAVRSAHPDWQGDTGFRVFKLGTSHG